MTRTFLIACLLLAQTAFAQSERITLSHPTTVVVDSKDNVFVGDGFKTYQITPAGEASVFVDGDQAKIRALRQENFKMAIDAQDNIYSIGLHSDSILKFTPDGQVSDYVGNPKYKYDIVDGVGAVARFSSLETIAIGPDGKLFVTDRSEGLAQADKARYKSNLSYALRSIDTALNVKTMRTQEGTPKWFQNISNIAVTADGALIFGQVYELRKWSDNKFETIAGLPKKAKAPIKSTGASHYIRFVLGDINKAEFTEASQIVVNKKGEIIFNHSPAIRILKLANNEVTLVAGANDMTCYLQVICGGAAVGYKDGKATAALFSYINAMALDRNDNIYVVDPGNKAIRKISTDGMVTTVYK